MPFGRLKGERMANSTASQKRPFHEEFAEKIIGMLEQGTAPWQKPWTPATNMIPRNPLSGTVYKGVNRLGLDPFLSGFEDPRWMTLKQANAAGYRAKPGSRSTPVVYYQFDKYQDKLDENREPVLDPDGKPIRERILLERPIMRIARVFNAEQIEGFPALEKSELAYEWEPQEKAQEILEKSGAVIRHDQSDRAFYAPSRDEIHLPPQDSFDASDKYYATALHELGHWTGHESRMGRKFGPRGSQDYAREELRAEISSWMLGQDIGVGHEPGQHAAYVQSWVKMLKEQPLEIFRACRDAEKMRDYMMGLEMEKGQQIAQEVEQTKPVEQNMALPVDPALAKTYLHVPYAEKDIAKAHGARWDARAKQWFCPEGTDLAPLRQYVAVPEREVQPRQCLDPREEFAQKLAELGFDLKGQLPELDGKPHRVPLLSKNGRGLDDVYCLYGDGRPAGWAQNHVTGEKVKLVASGMVLSAEERERQQAERAARIQEREQARAQEYDAAAIRAQRQWNSFDSVHGHKYLQEKGVEAFGLKQVDIDAEKSRLVIPLRNIEGELRGYQTIDQDGEKRFFAGMEKRGNFHLIGGEGKDLAASEIILCEGYATGASLHMASEKPVAVAFDAGNLEIVATRLREKYPQAQITICADNDHAVKRDDRLQNIGVAKAEQAARAVGGKVIVPVFSREEKAKGMTDFNDLHQSRGLDAVKKQLGIRDLGKGVER